MTIWQMSIAFWIPKANKHTLRICNTYCFPTATMVARMRHNVVTRALLVLLPTVIRVTMIRYVSWAEHVTRMGAMRNTLRELVDIPDGRKSISRPSYSWWGPLMVAQWLIYCATNRKVASSIPDGVIGIFH
jgi:hypothetical protein